MIRFAVNMMLRSFKLLPKVRLLLSFYFFASTQPIEGTKNLSTAFVHYFSRATHRTGPMVSFVIRRYRPQIAHAEHHRQATIAAIVRPVRTRAGDCAAAHQRSSQSAQVAVTLEATDKHRSGRRNRAIMARVGRLAEGRQACGDRSGGIRATSRQP